MNTKRLSIERHIVNYKKIFCQVLSLLIKSSTQLFNVIIYFFYNFSPIILTQVVFDYFFSNH